MVNPYAEVFVEHTCSVDVYSSGGEGFWSGSFDEEVHAVSVYTGCNKSLKF